MVKKILLGIVGFFVVAVLGLVLFVSFSGPKTFDAPYPDIHASTDSAIIARGEYLVYGPAHCGTCHIPMKDIHNITKESRMPLVGGLELPTGIATVRASNITPDKETGIGAFSDAEIARALRYGVKHDGQVIFPIMFYPEMTDEDVTAVISYLRSREPVRVDSKKTEYTFLGKALLAFGLFKPMEWDKKALKHRDREPTAAYGEYMAKTAACIGCHTKIDEASGTFAAPLYSGGAVFEAIPGSSEEGYHYMSPNLTPDKETGYIADWTEEDFIDRMQAGRGFMGSPMPWESYALMDSTDLIALYKYFQSLEPVQNEIAQTVFLPDEKLPK